MVEGVGSWRNFDDIEEYLILDELLLLSDQLNKSKRDNYKMLAAVQGGDIGDDNEPSSISGDELPQELLERERAWQAKKAEQEKDPVNEFDGFKLGYTKK